MSDWRDRLRDIMENVAPTRSEQEVRREKIESRRREIEHFIQNTVLPAFEEIRKELEKYGRRAEIVPGRYKARLEVYHNDLEEFSYVVRGDVYHRLSFAWPVQRSETEVDVARAVIQRPGGRGRAFKLDEYTKDGIIEDFLVHYKDWVQ